MKKPSRKALERAGYCIAFGCAAGLIFNIIFFSLTKDISGRKNQENSSTGFSINFGAGADDEFEPSIFVDSILSIIKSYYVDPSRTKNLELLSQTLESLAQFPEITLDKRSSSDYKMVVNGKTHNVVVTQPFTDRDLLKAFVGLSLFLSHNLKKEETSLPAAWIEHGENVVINALLQSLDAHSSLLSEEAYNELRQGTDGAFGGLGVVVGERDDLLTVLKPIPRSPAARSGIRKMDKIVSVDGKNTYGFTLDQLVETMRGMPGTSVTLGILRDGAEAPREFSIKRELINVDSVASKVVNDGSLKYLWSRIDSFSSHTAEELSKEIAKFRKANNGKVDGLILDLRSNPGGLLDQAIEVANLFVESGVLVSTKGRRIDIESAHRGIKYLDFPLVVLMNEDSASASEIVAGALQDHQRAVVVGQPSFGKGSVQTIFELPGQQALKLTIARYYTPLGKSIQNIGIQPDIWLQPIVTRSENRNLLGMYRYRNERFLRNRLEPRLADAPLAAKDLMQSFKAFYLVDRDLDEFEEAAENVPEIKIAKTIISEVRRVHKGGLDVSNNRSGHWLAVSGPAVASVLTSLDEKATEWLAQNHQISWEESKTDVKGLNLKIGIPGKKKILNVAQGDELVLPWSLVNESDAPVQRVSFYATPDVGVMEAGEVLVGVIPPGGKKTGIMKLRSSRQGTTRHVVMRIGAATNAVPISGASTLVDVFVNDRPSAKISTEASIVESANSKISGVLEPDEVASLHVEVRNTSNLTARGVKVRVRNLSGKQIFVGEQEVNVGDLPGGQSRYVDVELKGAKKFVTSKMPMGIVVSSNDFYESHRQTVLVDSSNGVAGKDISKSFAH